MEKTLILQAYNMLGIQNDARLLEIIPNFQEYKKQSGVEKF